ncbi:MAG: hypothetical protein ACREFF_00955 [Candidatus Udaeobacter sp.]
MNVFGVTKNPGSQQIYVPGDRCRDGPHLNNRLFAKACDRLMLKVSSLRDWTQPARPCPGEGYRSLQPDALLHEHKGEFKEP